MGESMRVLGGRGFVMFFIIFVSRLGLSTALWGLLVGSGICVGLGVVNMGGGLACMLLFTSGLLVNGLSSLCTLIVLLLWLRDMDVLLNRRGRVGTWGLGSWFVRSSLRLSFRAGVTAIVRVATSPLDVLDTSDLARPRLPGAASIGGASASLGALPVSSCLPVGGTDGGECFPTPDDRLILSLFPPSSFLASLAARVFGESERA